MSKEIFQTFLPWLSYFLLAGSSRAQMKIAILVAAIVALISERNGIKKKFILSWVTLLFFTFMFIAVVLFNNEWLVHHAAVLSNAALAFVAWFSILIKRPFTLQYAKEKVPAEKWSHPLFWRINYLLTLVWGCIFLFSTFIDISRLYFLSIHSWVYELFTNGLVIFGIWFSVWFPNWYVSQIKNRPILTL